MDEKQWGYRNGEEFPLIQYLHVATTTKWTIECKWDCGAAIRAQVVDVAPQDYWSKYYLSLNVAAKAYGVLESTLRACKNRCVSPTKSHEKQQVLFKSEEKILV